MRGIITFFKKSRISKIIIGVILPFQLLLLSFLLGAVEVSASSSPGSGWESGLLDFVGETHTSRWIIDSVLDSYNQWVNLDLDNGDYIIDYAPTSGQMSFKYKGNISMRFQYTSNNFNNFAACLGTLHQRIYCTTGRPTFNYGTNYYWYSIVDEIEILSNYQNEFSYQLTSQTGNTFTIDTFGRYWDLNFATTPIYVDVNIKLTGIATTNNVSESNYNIQLRDAMASSSMPTFTEIQGVDSYKSLYYSETSEFEFVRNLDTKLYNIWVTDNLIYDQLRLNGSSDNFANTINSELVRDAAQAHSDSLNVQDKMMNDSTNFSSNQNTLKNDIDVKQAAADSAIDGAVHNYDSDLDTVTEFNWKNFFTSQSGAATFWRDVGEYIFNSSNLGFIATGLAIVTIVTLFVFLLRL